MSELDLTAIEARANRVPPRLRVWQDQRNIAKVPNLVNFDDLGDDMKASYAVLHTDEPQSNALLGALSAHVAGMDPATTLALVAEVRRLEAELDSLAETHDRCRYDIAEPGYRAP